jgi:hypothetical protein
VTDAAALHFWRVCSALGLDSSPPPTIERARHTSSHSQAEILATLRSRLQHATAVVAELTDAQLEVVEKSSPRSVAEIIERPLIRHLGTHRAEIERKLRSVSRSG